MIRWNNHGGKKLPPFLDLRHKLHKVTQKINRLDRTRELGLVLTLDQTMWDDCRSPE